MKTKISALLPALCLLAIPAAAFPEPPARPVLTVYADNLGLVSQVRSVNLDRNVTEVRLDGLPALIEPASVQMIPVGTAGGLKLLEQRFEYDLEDTGRLLQRYIGHAIQVTTREGETVSGTLLQESGGDAVLQLADRSFKVVRAQTLQTFLLPELPQGLATKPVLIWRLQCDKPAARQIETLYLTKGLQWSAAYMARLSPEEDRIDLSGLATVENHCGLSFPEARLTLVAGEVRREQPPYPRPMEARRDVALAAKAAPAFEESPLFEYHAYRLDRAVTLENLQTTGIPLFEPAGIRVEKGFAYDGERDGDKVTVDLTFRNLKTEGLGIPLPAGKVQVYKKGKDASLVFVGEDALKHTPEGEEIKLSLGYVFDIVGERTVVETRQVAKGSRKETVEIRLRNHKEAEVKVYVVEHLRGNWEFVGETPAIRKKEASKVEFAVKVPKQGELSFQYTVLYTW